MTVINCSLPTVTDWDVSYI